MGEKVKDFFKKNFGYVVVGLVSAIYIATSVITMGKTGKTFGEIMADGAIVLFLGVFINRVFDLQGMMNGDREERVQETIRLHGEAVVRVSPYLDRLDKWCEEKNREALKMQRTKILASEGLRYDDYFDDKGGVKPYVVDKEKLKDKYLRGDEIKRLRCFRRALRLKLTPLTASGLTSEGGKKQDPYYLGRTKTQYERETTISDVVTKIIIACLFGYYGAELVQDFSYADLIWKVLQIGIFFIAGVIKMYQSYMFVVDEYRGRIIKKIDNLQKFENYIHSEINTEVKEDGVEQQV
nr:MAG TPA: hypothetical protein [Caudoviricetes sp.]